MSKSEFAGQVDGMSLSKRNPNDRFTEQPRRTLCLYKLQNQISISQAMLRPRQLSLSDVHMLERHEAWMSQHGRVYKDTVEKIKRFEIYKNNVQKIEAFNAGPDRGYKLGVNAFADMTSEEIRASYTGYKRQTTNPKMEYSSEHKPFRYANVTSVPV
ncbi:hypothetical protein ACP275_13G169600 [Erythranthe tilingii]